MKVVLSLANVTKEERVSKVKEIIQGYKMIDMKTVGDLKSGLVIFRSYIKDNIILNSKTESLSNGFYNVEINQFFN